MLTTDSNALFIEPKYYIRYLIYTDPSRKQARLYMAYWANDKVIKDLVYGSSFETQRFEPVRSEPLVLTVANRPILVEMPHPKHPEHIVLVYDVFLAPKGNWALYEELGEVSWAVELLEG